MTGGGTNRHMPPKVFPSTKRIYAKGKEYLYFRTGKFKANGQEILAPLPARNAENFGAVYGAMMGVKTKRAKASGAGELTVPGLIDLYEKSHEFTKLAESSKRQYRIRLDQLRAQFPTAPAGRLERRDVIVVLEKMVDRPGAANLFLAVTSALYKWGRGKEKVTNRPCDEIDLYELGEHDPWPDHVLTAALAADNDRMRLAAHLLYYTALRIGDVCSLRWTDVRDNAIFVVPQKVSRKKGRKQPIRIPLHYALAEELARHQRGLTTILAKPDGKPWVQDTIRNELQAFALTMGVEVVPHGLRKNAVNSLLEAGCTAAEAAAISDQSLQMVEHYSRLRNQSVLGSAAILKWERKK